MTDTDQEDARTARLPVSGDVVQWLQDDRWRMVTRAQFETEQSRSPRLSVVWNKPDDSPDGISGETNIAPDNGGPWWRFQGMVTDDLVEARYPDGSEAPLIPAGPVWVIEGLVILGKPYVSVGESFSGAGHRAKHPRTATSWQANRVPGGAVAPGDGG